MVAQANQAETPTVQPENEPAFAYTVPVRIETPEECVPRTQVLSVTNPFMLILPRDMRRCRAVIIPVTNPVYLCESPDTASQIAAYAIAGNTAVTSMGAYLPVNVGVPIDHRDVMYCAISSTASTSPVSVIVQRYAD
jgi:hypothetical protein